MPSERKPSSGLKASASPSVPLPRLVTGELWALLRLSGQTGRELVTIDPTTGVATNVGDTGDRFAGIAFDSSGILYGVTGDGANTPETLFTLSTVDATATQVTSLGNGTDGEALAFNPDDGLFYHASGLNNNVFETVNPISFSVTNIPLSGDTYSEALSLTYEGSGVFLLGDLDQRLYRITASGAVTLLGTLDHRAKGLAVVR